jgi:phosphohistidine phosphatase SixA
MAIVTTNYLEAVKDVLRTLEGPFSAQPLTGVVTHNPNTNRVLYYIVGQDKNGEDVLKKPAIVQLTDEGKIVIEKNNTDLDIRKELMALGVPAEDIVRK